MTGAVDRLGAAARRGPGGPGQATQVEQSRAVAEVEAAVWVAKAAPRDEEQARIRMQRSAGLPRVAERAFYAVPRGGSTATGPSVHLARELARCWGNIQYGVTELSRDGRAGEFGESEMRAWAWDLETNAMHALGFVVPHARKVKSELKRLGDDLNAVYENNANNGARRLRQCLYAVMPPWFTGEAEDIARQALEAGDGTPLAERITNMLGGFRNLQVTEDDIARRLQRPRPQWTAIDVANLKVVFTSLQRNEITRDDAFPAPARLTPADTAPVPAPAPSRGGSPSDAAQVDTATARAEQPDATPTPAPVADAGEYDPFDDPAPAADKDVRRLNVLLGKLGVGGEKSRPDRLAVLAAVLEREVLTSKGLPAGQVAYLIHRIEPVAGGVYPGQLAAWLVAGHGLNGTGQAP